MNIARVLIGMRHIVPLSIQTVRVSSIFNLIKLFDFRLMTVTGFLWRQKTSNRRRKLSNDRENVLNRFYNCFDLFNFFITLY